MRFEDSRIVGAKIIHPNKIEDERGYFARAWCEDTLRDAGLTHRIRQSNMAANHIRGTLRGLHLQAKPYREVKIVACVRGAMYDVVVDLRPDSPTYLQWDGIELSESNNLAFYIPEGCATGYLTLTNECAMYYHTSERFHPETAYGVRYDDPAIGIEWPMSPLLMSDQDAHWPYLKI